MKQEITTILIFLVLVLFSVTAEGQTGCDAVVADSMSRRPLPNASVFDRHGKFIGSCRAGGKLPYIPIADYPVTIRYMGFKEHVLSDAACNDTIFLQESITELPEVVIESRQHKLLHILAYVREYSTLSTYTDSVFLFREKMVDYMLPSEKKVRFKGWTSPRVITSKSYYRFTNATGLDSVSDRCSHHFSWADWVGIVPAAKLPAGLCGIENGTDTVRGKYSPTETWVKNGDRVTLDVNVMADTASRKWVPNLSLFFRDDVDFEQFKVRFNYDDIVGDILSPIDLTGYSFNIESNGRGHGLFRFNRHNEPFFVSSYAEVYIIDKEYITVKEAKKWGHRDAESNEIEIFEPAEAPALQPSIQMLVDRVNAVDHDLVRLDFTPDQRLAGRKIQKMNIGQRVLKRVKQMFGIDNINAERKWRRQWNDFSKIQSKKNNKTADEEQSR